MVIAPKLACLFGPMFLSASLVCACAGVPADAPESGRAEAQGNPARRQLGEDATAAGTSSTPPAQAPQAEGGAAPSSTAAAATGAAAGGPPRGAGSPSPGGAPAVAVKATSAAECKAAAAKIPAPAIAATDVRQQMSELFQAYHESFRCCFDVLWAPQHPGVNGKVALRTSISRHGELTDSAILPADTSVPSPEVHACILDIAKSLPYPKPAHGKDIDYQRNLDFKARR